MKKFVILMLLSNIAFAESDYAAYTDEYLYTIAKEEGCSSAKSDGGYPFASFKKDVEKYVKRPYYQTGWQDGYAKCKASMDDTRAIVNRTMFGW
jgi:hypothetical protein